MSEHQCVIEARNVSVFHHSGALVSKKSFVVRNLSLHVHEGEIVGLAGESGSGKTSFGKALLNLIPTWEGDVYWNGSNIRKTDIRRSDAITVGCARSRRSRSTPAEKYCVASRNRCSSIMRRVQPKRRNTSCGSL